MSKKVIQAWFSCQMPGCAAAWDDILFARTQAQEYLFEFELRTVFEAYPQSDFEPAFAVFLASANLEVTTENIPPFGDVNVIYINKPYVDSVGAAVMASDYDNQCTVWGFNGTPYPGK